MLALGCDHGGFPLMKEVKKYLDEQGIAYQDFGTCSEESCDYPVYARKVAKAVLSGECEKGILICGTGQGMAIVANKHKGIYACVVDSVFSGERAKIINNANVITLGGWITAPFLGCEIVDAWLSMQFTQKMEFKKDFLTKNFHIVEDIEKENFR
jgi:ribose 5-phosphate isomerase B